MKRVVFCVGIMFSCMGQVGKHHLLKVEHRKACLLDELRWYFSERPAVVYQPDFEKTAATNKNITLLFPLASCTHNQIAQVQKQLAHAGIEASQFTLEYVKKPVKALRLSVQYDPCLVDVEYGPCFKEPEQCLVIKVIQKKMLKRLSRKMAHRRWIC